jgi:hypothetical protein
MSRGKTTNVVAKGQLFIAVLYMPCTLSLLPTTEYVLRVALDGKQEPCSQDEYHAQVWRKASLLPCNKKTKTGSYPQRTTSTLQSDPEP